MGKRSMCGITGSETSNGAVTTLSATNIIDSGATFPVNCVGHKLYILDGNNEGDECTITVRNSATNVSVTGLSAATVVGDRYSVSPVVTRVVLPQLLSVQGDIDPFVRKVMTGMSVAFSDLGGEYAGANGKIIMGAKDGSVTITSTQVAMDPTPDSCVGRVNAAATRLYPFVEVRAGNMDFEIQAILVNGVASSSEFQSRTGT
jgi:hypothetical protein